MQVVKNPPANTGDIRDTGSIPWLGRSPGEGNGNPLQYFSPGRFHGERNLPAKHHEHKLTYSIKM